ncbi:MAG: protein jag [Desulfofustis sp. PB-SRB1]|jgi:spoIIIJ-associated protein|nr:protein jag [Desulfofustis sp. PB-SRB1]MBM1001311.1 protein jag [Desulfofustis sp. PB-SRB1]HBH28922.1 protein jag [Desulfofustis sp.]HBH30377.1 protein jag [Desulfofustis sp.]
MAKDTKDFFGKDVAEAIKEACATFAVAQEHLDIEVIETGTQGIFGLIRRKAHIKARVQKDAPSPPEVEKKQPEKAPRRAAKKTKTARVETVEKNAPAAEPVAEEAVPVPVAEAPAARPAVADISEQTLATVKTELEQILALMQCPSTVRVTVQDSIVQCRIEGDYEDTLTGQDGRVLDALQYLLRKIVAKKGAGSISLLIDVGDYREQKQHHLREQALQLAEDVKKTGKTQVITSLNPSERRVVHVALQGDSQVRSRSIGDGPFKKVLIYQPTKSRKDNGRKKSRSRPRGKTEEK